VSASRSVTERKIWPANARIVGAPAAVRRTLAEDEVKRLAESADICARKADRFRTELERID
jgi:carbonic anhydrase/acetyltransferase-like protein (isoleucine patch superfamily)